MNRFSRQPTTNRSKEAPMDFEWTSRPSVSPVWSNKENDSSTPRKRPIGEVHEPHHMLDVRNSPVFGATHNQNVPFIFQSPAPPQSPVAYPWSPPPNFSASKAFQQEDLKDVDMSETSPAKTEVDSNENENGRPIALGALRRVYNQRQKSRIRKSQAGQRLNNEDEGPDLSEDDDDIAPVARKTSNHYTLNMPAPAASPSEVPYVLLGYLQFFFNLSLILLFLYLVVQFIITIQRDVQQKVAEYSQEIVQEIAMCALQFKNNLCESNPVPAMIQQCAKWEACMNRDPAVVGRAKVSAELIAEVVNSFVEPISWKTLAFTLSSLAFLTVFVNALLSLYRSRHQPVNHTSPQSHLYPMTHVAPFPQYLSHQNHWSRIQRDDNPETPARRRRLEGGNPEKIK